MIKVGYIPMLSGDSTDFYRCSGVLNYLNSNDTHFKAVGDTFSMSWDKMVGLDFLIVQRPFKSISENVISLAKDMNIKVVVDYDDDLFNIPMYNPSYELYSSSQESLKNCVAMADEVWVSTEALREVYEQYNPMVVVIKNAHNDYMFPVEKKKLFNHDTKLAVYRGGASHFEDMYAYQDLLVDKINNNLDWEYRFLGNSYAAPA